MTEIKTLADVAHIVAGSGFNETFQGRTDLSIPFVKVSDFQRSVDNWLSSAANTVDGDMLKALGAKKYPTGTIIFPKVGGALLTNKRARLAVDAAMDNNVMGLIPRDIDPDYLFYFMCFFDMGRIANAQALPSVSAAAVAKIELPVPSTEESQRQIAAKLKSQLAEVETARQALAVQLADVFQLERLYFDEFESQLFSSAENSLFSNFVESYKNGYGARPKEGETGSIVLRIADVSQGIINLSSTRQGAISARNAETYKLEKGNLIFIRVNGAKHIVGKCILVEEIPDGTIFNDHLIRVRLSDDILPEYAQLCASLPNARQMIEEAASTSAGQLTVNQKNLDQIALPYVDKSCQVKMVDEYRNLRSEITTLKKAINQQLDDLNKIPERLLAQAFNQ